MCEAQAGSSLTEMGVAGEMTPGLVDAHVPARVSADLC